MANKSFLFLTDDVIVCEYDPIKKQIAFKKYKSTNRFTMNVEISAGEKVYPCASICNKGEKVEIVNHIDLSTEEF